MKKQSFRTLAAALLTAAILGACASPQPTPPDAQQPIQGGNLLLATVGEPTVLNPLLWEDAASATVGALLFDSLIRVDEQLQYSPWLAETLPTSEAQGLAWRFRLRPGVTFADNEPLTSSDVRFTFEAIFHPGYTGPLAPSFRWLRGAATLEDRYRTIDRQVEQGGLTRAAGERAKAAAWDRWRTESGAIETPDALTVIFTLEQPYTPFLARVAQVGILPEHLLADRVGTMRGADFNLAPVGSGRYVLSEWKAGEYVQLRANNGWWGDRPHIDQVIIRPYRSVEQASAALQRGQVDSAPVPLRQARTMQRQTEAVRLYEATGTAYVAVSLNLSFDLFLDPRVRRAISYATDRALLIQRLLNGHGTEAWSHGSPARWDFNENVTRFAYDPARAAALLEEAGWLPGPDGIRQKHDRRLAFDLYYDAGDESMGAAAQMLRESWRQAGIGATPVGVDLPLLLGQTDVQNLNRQQPPAYLSGWNVGVDPDSTPLWSCDGILNDIGYCSPTVEELLRRGREAVQTGSRLDYYRAIQQRLAEDQPYIWLYLPHAIWGVSARVKGPISATPAGPYWNIEQWWIDPQR